MDGFVQVVDGDAGRRRHEGVRVVGIDAVEAQQAVEVHGGPALHLGDLAVRHPHRRHPADLARAGDGWDERRRAERGEVPFDGLLGAPPQLAGDLVPDDLAGRGRSSPGTTAARAADRRRRGGRSTPRAARAGRCRRRAGRGTGQGGSRSAVRLGRCGGGRADGGPRRRTGR